MYMYRGGKRKKKEKEKETPDFAYKPAHYDHFLLGSWGSWGSKESIKMAFNAPDGRVIGRWEVGLTYLIQPERLWGFNHLQLLS